MKIWKTGVYNKNIENYERRRFETEEIDDREETFYK